MTDRINDIHYLLNHPVFRKLQAFGLIDDFALRNLLIKKEFRILHKKLYASDCFFILSQKYFLSDHTIMNILYRKRNKKRLPISAIKF